MKSNSVQFVPNVPQQIALKYLDGRPVKSGFRVMFWLMDGRVMFVSPELGKKIEGLGLKPGESFHIVKHWNGQRGRLSITRWDVWLSNDSEMARAAEEFETMLETPADLSVKLATPEDLTPILQESIQMAQGKLVQMPQIPISSPVAPTGTDGPGKLPLEAPASSGGGRIPFDVAFTEAVGIVKRGLEANGEQWNDAAKQDAVSTILISLSQMGKLTLWERGA